MLHLENIRKSYTTANFTQNALDGVSIAFRKNEFTAILGPSGSGKSTMLNIIGGLDQCDSGELTIDNISTKKYKDRDWDTYRNNRIGFVFQSYNLIPHQTILSNVELALTLSGVSKAERRERAIKALEEVGLEKHIRKRPNQLSGGQMQRVAIARALVNDPEILLADEPTGAVDSETSVRIMDLLTAIAKDRLVIMVTHNNELAEQYANRIIHLKDGLVVSDSHPYDPYNPNDNDDQHTREIRKASMSFMTAISLSFSNLMTKKWRTLVTSLAGSIGIIGIAAILALATGINLYIQRIEEETLSLYPLMIQSTSLNLGNLFGGRDDSGERVPRTELPPEHVRERRVVRSMFSAIHINDLASLKEYFEDINQEIHAHVSTIHYMYDITPQIFIINDSDNVEQVNPDEIFEGTGMGAQQGPMNFGFFAMGMQVFHEMPNNLSLFENQYEILTGRWPEHYDEVVLVLSHGGAITDFEIFSMGLRDRAELSAMLESFMAGTEIEIDIDGAGGVFSYETLMAVDFRVVNPADTYQFDEEFGVWVDRSNDDAFMRSLVDDALALKIVGIVRPDPSSNIAMLSPGINYMPELIHHLIEQAAKTSIVNHQIANPDVNVFTGRTFEDERENPRSEFDFGRIVSIDEDILSDLFDFEFREMEFDPGNMNFNLSGLDFDMSSFNLDPSDFNFTIPNINFDPSDILGNLTFNIDPSAFPPPPEVDIVDVHNAVRDMMTVADYDAMMVPLIDALEIDQGLPPGTFSTLPPEEQAARLNTFLNSPDGQILFISLLFSTPGIDYAALVDELLVDTMAEYMQQIMAIIEAQIMATIEQAMQLAMAGIANEIQNAMTPVMEQVITTISREIQNAMSGSVDQITGLIADSIEEMLSEMFESMEDMFDFDEDAFAEAFQIEMGEEEIFDLMMSVMNPTVTTFERNLTTLGYADLSNPSQINIFPRSFESKQVVLDILANYNERMEDNGEPEKIIRFIDIVGVMMASVTEIVDLVSYGLIAFVSISLVVSSIMIGVITFISVLERKKEIGILRAIGASKQNIRTVFNAEALIIGFVAGVLGVLITLIIVFIGNIILYNRFEVENLAHLPAYAAIILIAVSMFLTFIAGLFPSSAAARKDPVEALRSE